MKATVQTVIIEQPTPTCVRVAWCNARRARGIFDIDFEDEEGMRPSSYRPAAELLALHQILYPDPKLGVHNVPAVHRPNMYVSDPETLRVVHKISKCAGAYPYANFLRTHQTADQVFLASQLTSPPWDDLFPDGPDIGDPEPFLITPRMRSMSFVLWAKGLGAVGLTEHAVERYCEFEGGALNPVHSILTQLSHEDLHRVALPEIVLKQKLIKYNDTHNLECWRHPNGNRLFLMMRGKHCRTLITLVDLPKERLAKHTMLHGKPAKPCPYERMLMF